MVRKVVGMPEEITVEDYQKAMAGLRLLGRDAQALADHEKTLITQRLDSHNSYMESRSLSA